MFLVDAIRDAVSSATATANANEPAAPAPAAGNGGGGEGGDATANPPAEGDANKPEGENGTGAKSPPDPEKPPRPRPGTKKKVKRKFKEPIEFPEPVKIPKTLRQPGQLLSFGKNPFGQLGNSVEGGQVVFPTPVPIFMDKKIKKVACGAKHTLVLDSDGVVWSFGSNRERALGRVTSCTEEEIIPSPVEIPGRVKQITAGDSHGAALTEEGEVYAWGSYKDRCGKMYAVDSYMPDEEDQEFTSLPWLITHHLKESEDDINIIKIVSGANHIAMLGDDSKLYTCGAWSNGQLGRLQSEIPQKRTRGLEDTEVGFQLTVRECYLKPRWVPIGYNALVTNIWATGYATFAYVGKTNNVFVCGSNLYSQLGIKVNKEDVKGKTKFITSPTKVSSLNGKSVETVRWRQIAGGAYHTIALSETGQVYTLGSQRYGKLGIHDKVDKDAVEFEPKLVAALEKKICVQVGAGDRVSFALTLEGELYSWGSATTMQLASICVKDRMKPLPCALPTGEYEKISAFSVGGEHVAALALIEEKEEEGIPAAAAN